ncbi:MAG TPA: hypothetical protein VN018_09400 [Brevundimonas sp.]|nr:hypothetical protein [Brevundimonas sp.]
METVLRIPSARLAALLLIAGATMIGGNAANAREPVAERLSRPNSPSIMGQDGRLQVSPNATLGNLLVDQYSNFGRRLLAPGANPDAVALALQPVMCARQGVNASAAIAVRGALRDLDRTDRARLKGGDPESLTQFSITILAQWDRVNADDIRADEALGPGVYHEAIAAFRSALQLCDLL